MGIKHANSRESTRRHKRARSLLQPENCSYLHSVLPPTLGFAPTAYRQQGLAGALQQGCYGRMSVQCDGKHQNSGGLEAPQHSRHALHYECQPRRMCALKAGKNGTTRKTTRPQNEKNQTCERLILVHNAHQCCTHMHWSVGLKTAFHTGSLKIPN